MSETLALIPALVAIFKWLGTKSIPSASTGRIMSSSARSATW